MEKQQLHKCAASTSISANKRLRDPLVMMFRYSISVYIFIFVKDSRWPVVKTDHFLSCSSFFTFWKITLEKESCTAIRYPHMTVSKGGGALTH